MDKSYPLDKVLLPMNGTSVKDPSKMEEIWESEEYIAEPKLDGSRYISIGGRFFSRRLSVKDGMPVEKTENVPHLNFALSSYPNLILDGEIYLYGGTSNEVTSIMGSKPDRAIEIQKGQGYLLYYVFDILRDIDGTWLIDLSWKERRKRLEEVYFTLSKHNKVSHIYLTPYVIENKKEYYAKILEKGGEGVMLKNINGVYVPDKRPRWNWIKVKREMTDDVVIMGFEPPVMEYTGKELDTWPYWVQKGTGIRQLGSRPTGEDWIPVTRYYFHEWIGAVVFGKYDNQGNLVRLGSCSGLSDELRRDMSLNPDKYIGEVMEISAMQKTKDGFYRHPQFLRLRPDKNAKDCVL